jgi:signal transduction histidine kinase
MTVQSAPAPETFVISLATPRVPLFLNKTERRRTTIISLLVLVTYYLTAKIGFEFVLQPSSVSTLWMPNSILLAGLLLTNPRFWWLIIIAALPAHLASELQSGVPTSMVLCWFVSNSVQALLGAGLIWWFIKARVRFARLKELVIFLILGVFLAPFLASFLDSALVRINGWGTHSYWELWRLRFLSNVLATLTLVPFVVVWANSDLSLVKRTSLLRYAEGFILIASLFVVSVIVFTTPNTALEWGQSRLYWPLPFLVWATVSFGLRGISFSLLIVMFLAIIGATKNAGPFVNSSSAYNAMAIQGFLIIVSVPLIVLAVVMNERQLTEEALGRINERHQAILRAVPDVMFLQDSDGVYLDYYTQHPEKLLVPPSQFLGRKASEVLPADLAIKVEEVIARLKETDEPQVFEYSIQLPNQQRHFEARLVKAEGDYALSIVRDITEARRATDAAKESERRLLESSTRIRKLAGQLITAQESERRRIAVFLHDDVGQNVATLGLGISRLKHKLCELDSTITPELTRLSVQVQDLTAQIRQLSHQLHPEVLEHLGLVKALEVQVAEFSDEEQVAIKFSSDVKSSAIPSDVAVALYRVALEAVRNVSKHSGANSANVNLRNVDGYLELEVSDTGHGFDVEHARHGSGLGLLSSEERVRLLHGSLVIKSNSQNGTTLIARVPLS